MRSFRAREPEPRTTIFGLWKRRVDNVQMFATPVTEKDSPGFGSRHVSLTMRHDFLPHLSFNQDLSLAD